jgi:transcriptional regulator GlxA family with amidase domain
VTDSDVVAVITAVVTADPAGDYRGPRLAELTGVSSRHLARLFWTTVGTSPARYVEGVRFAVACRALTADATASLSEVTRAAGFGSAETMRRVFSRRLGITPGAYRAANSAV